MAKHSKRENIQKKRVQQYSWRDPIADSQMNEQPSIEDRISHELRNAQLARQRGNEGMARVCARRAAGMAVSNYFREAGNFNPLESPFEMLRKFF